MTTRQDDASISSATMVQNEERRGEARDQYGERARLIFDRSTIECTVLDMSSNGARIRLGTPAIVPEQLILRFHQGEAFAARRLWTLHEQIGLLFDRSAPLMRGTAPAALLALEALPANGLDDALRILKISAYMNDFALGEAAREAEAAYNRLKNMLGRMVR